MTDIKVYQGNQIGGCVTVISATHEGKTSRIMIDYGSSLPGSDTKVDFKYDFENEPVEAVFLTHYHGDHVGRLNEIPDHVPIYMGKTARQVMINIKEALLKREILKKQGKEVDGCEDDKQQDYEKDLALLTDDTRIHTFEWNGKTYNPIIEYEGFRVEPYSVDHSAYDAYMFLIEVEDETKPTGKKVILHTGDFRGHGRLGKAMLPIIKYYVHKNERQVDSLIIEGTMMSRPADDAKSEHQMMLEAAEYLEEHKYAFLICSSTNLDSLASFYQAAQIAASPYQRYLYTYSEYFRTQLQMFSDTAGAFSDVYQFQNVYTLSLDKELTHEKWKHPKTQKELMERAGFLATIRPEKWCDKYIDPFIEDYKAGKIEEMPVIIYSMWDGYVQEYRTLPDGAEVENKAKKQEWIDFFTRQKAKGVEIKHLHTSGHASKPMIEAVITKVNPQEEIIPMHTECQEKFEELDISDELIKRIKIDK